MRRLAVAAVAAGALLVLTPGTAGADVIFDQADADDLAATLAEAYQTQGVCYGWRVSVSNVGIQEYSVGSNFGAGQQLSEVSTRCDKMVEFQASITWTSESSESEDSAYHSVSSTPAGLSTSDLDSLGIISDEGLSGENPDVDVYKAVSALPLLAADAGLADPIEASPAPESAAAGAVPTNSPGSDFWRQAGGAVTWALIMFAAALLLLWWGLRTRRKPAVVGPAEEQIPAEWFDQSTAPGAQRQRENRPGPPGQPGDPGPGQGSGPSRRSAGPPPGPGQPGPAGPGGRPQTPLNPNDPETRPEG